MEDFVTFEFAQKLKEKGYPLLRVIKQNGNPVIYDLPKNHPNWQDCKAYYIPTVFQVLKWLREEKEIDIVIYPIDASTVFMGGEKYILSIYIDRKRYYKIHHDNIDKYVQWEEAALAGIEYVLDNLL